MPRLSVLFGAMALTVSLALVLGSGPAHAQPAERPNFVILLVDDAALMDFGCYGGEARTPHIDALAARGALFTGHRTSPQCAPSRAMLLTGMDNHLTGHGTIPEVLPAEHRGKPGYTMALEPGVETIAARLKPLGYRTLITGKWHLGHGPGDLPSDHGFDRSFVLDQSGADNWEHRSYLPLYKDALWFEDGKETGLPEDFYSSRFIVDKMIDYLGDASQGEPPFLAYLGFQAIHIPVQAPAEYTAGYDGVFDGGWQAMLEARWQRAQALGIVPEGVPYRAPPEMLREWDALDEDEQALMARSMQVNAGMLEAMDHHIGRLVDHLRQTGAYDNTVFVITSDNGPEGGDPVASNLMAIWMQLTGYDRKLETLGEKGSYVAIGPEWARAAAGPSHLFKFYAAEGGLRVPLIMAGPGVPQGAQIDSFSVMTDITPTLIEMAGGQIPEGGAKPVTGRSLVPVLSGAAGDTYGPRDAVGIEVAGNAALYRGDYKLVRNLRPYGDGEWRLYNLTLDPGETRDLSQTEPELMAAMQVAYEDFSREMGVLDMPEGYEVVRQIGINSRPVMLRNYWWVPALALLVLLVALYGLYRLARALFRAAR